ncbi:MAG: lipopolysaccharide heptosyltransferase II [Candidatus Aminicenantes bacterium RBG_13_63_10]|nr:MAG: lipopolysaccharide heptosyltransferase II [Candidatus Aminicenantes bacterium RBG_13_63_10]
MKFLVRVPNWVGDCLLAIPALDSLRRNHPGSEIWLLARDWARDLFPPKKLVAGVIPLAGRESLGDLWRTARQLRPARFDAGLLLTNSLGSALMFALAGIPERWGYRREGRGFLLTRGVLFDENGPRRHQLEYYLDLIRGLGMTPAPPEVRLSLTALEKRAAGAALEAMGVDLARPVVILSPGASYGPAKRWPAERFAALGALFQKKDRAEIVLTGTADERGLAEKVASLLPRRAAVLAGLTDLRRLLSVMSRAALVVTNDSGPMHLANALRVPVAAVFGPTDPAATRPYHQPSVVLKKGAACWPCLYRQCPYDHRCMTAVSPEEVYAAGRGFLS